MDAKELIAQLVDIVEEKGNVDIQAQVLGNTHDIEFTKLYPGTDFEEYVLEVKS